MRVSISMSTSACRLPTIVCMYMYIRDMCNAKSTFCDSAGVSQSMHVCFEYVLCDSMSACLCCVEST